MGSCNMKDHIAQMFYPHPIPGKSECLKDCVLAHVAQCKETTWVMPKNTIGFGCCILIDLIAGILYPPPIINNI